MAGTIPPSREELMQRRQEMEAQQGRTSTLYSPKISTTLFEAGQGEEIKELHETPEGLVVITNKRIVRVEI